MTYKDVHIVLKTISDKGGDLISHENLLLYLNANPNNINTTEGVKSINGCLSEGYLKLVPDYGQFKHYTFTTKGIAFLRNWRYDDVRANLTIAPFASKEYKQTSKVTSNTSSVATKWDKMGVVVAIISILVTIVIAYLQMKKD